MATYSIEKRPVDNKLKLAIVRTGKEDSFIVIEDTDRLEQIGKIEDEETKQMKLQTMYLYRKAIGDKEYNDYMPNLKHHWCNWGD